MFRSAVGTAAGLAGYGVLRSESVANRGAKHKGSHAEQYRAARSARERVSNGYVLCDLGLRLVPSGSGEAAELPKEVTALVAFLETLHPSNERAARNAANAP